MHQDSPEEPSASAQSTEPSCDAICALYFPQVRAYLRSRGLGREDLEDSLQEVFVRFLSAMRAKKINPGHARGWLNAVARHVSADVIRARRRSAVPLDPLHDLVVEDPAPGIEELRRLVRAAIAQLPDQCRAAFLLKHYEQEGTNEIGKILGISRNAVYLRLFRARCLLFERLQKLTRP